MSNKTKAIVWGVGTFVLCVLLWNVARPLIKGTPIAEAFSSAWGWVISVVCGFCSGISALKQEDKKGAQKKDNE